MGTPRRKFRKRQYRFLKKVRCFRGDAPFKVGQEQTVQFTFFAASELSARRQVVHLEMAAGWHVLKLERLG